MLLTIKNLSVFTDRKLILSNISLAIAKGKIHILMGSNGSGKTSLCMALLGHPYYKITEGNILFNKKSITSLSTEKRANLGIFLSLQEPPEIEGVNIHTLLQTIAKKYHEKNMEIAMKEVEKNIKLLGLAENFTDRDLGDGLSGGEKKKNEILQLIAMNPKIAILDEIDSGMDIDSLKITMRILKKKVTEGMSLLLITHSTKILHILKPDFIHIMHKGKIIKSGNISLIKQIEKDGFKTNKS